MPAPDELPPEVAESIRKQRREGISYSLNRDLRTVTAIFWRPGDPNPLAEAILREVSGDEMPLILDGKAFVIRRGKL